MGEGNIRRWSYDEGVKGKGVKGDVTEGDNNEMDLFFDYSVLLSRKCCVCSSFLLLTCLSQVHLLFLMKLLCQNWKVCVYFLILF